MYIRQPYELYSAEDHETWRRLYQRLLPRWERYANERFQAGIQSLCLPQDRIPRLEEVNRFLSPLTGFRARAVSGYVPAFLFFDCLRNREFPTTVTIRKAGRLDYLPEPDIFHDIAGHVPMHTDPHFAETLVRFGECAHTAAALVSEIRDPAERVRTLTSIFRAMARFFWFTIEFGLMRSRNGLTSVRKRAAQLLRRDRARGRFPGCRSAVRCRSSGPFNQTFEIDHYQPLLFIVDSFDHLYSLVDELERWMKAGKLNHVAPGEPEVNEVDLQSFLEADTTC